MILLLLCYPKSFDVSRAVLIFRLVHLVCFSKVIKVVKAT